MRSHASDGVGDASQHIDRFIAEARLKQLRYEAKRRAWREAHPFSPAESVARKAG